MITARNYAAQAVASLRELAVELKNPQEAALCLVTADRIEKSVHFVVADGGLVFGKNMSIGDFDTPINLPYALITVEFFITYGEDKSKILIFARQQENFIDVHVLMSRNKDGWTPSPVYCRIDRTSPIYKEIYIIFENIYNQYCNVHGIEHYNKILNGSSDQALFTVFSLLQALSCKNVSTEIFKKEGDNNQKRINKGKLPFYETKMLVVDSTKSSGSVKNPAPGTTHASPRQHLRRGHIRRLPSGNIWVHACVVGDASKGTISKKYTVI